MSARLFCFSCVFVSAVHALNIVSNGPSLKRGPAQGASTVQLPKDKLADVFSQFDTDGNGFLDEAELAAAFEAMGHPATAATIHHSFSLMDKNHDGLISIDEFRAIDIQNIMPSLAEISMADNNRVFEDVVEPIANLRDQKLAKEKPKEYCADRCLTLGFCEVLEDFLEMSTAQVQAFCESCAGEDECELAYL